MIPQRKAIRIDFFQVRLVLAFNEIHFLTLSPFALVDSCDDPSF